MKKFLLFALSFIFVAFVSNAQITNGGFETWSSTNPDGWGGSKTASASQLVVTKVTTDAHGGTNACSLKNTTTSHKRFTSTATTVTNGTSYELSFWLKGTTGQVRTGMYTGINGAASGYLTYNDYVSATATWTQVTQTLVADGDVSVAEFIFSVGNMGDIVIDDVTIGGAVETPQANIVSFSIPQQSSAAVINSTAGTVAIQVVSGTVLTALVPTITVSDGATISPAGGVATDFTSAKSYVVTASDATTKNWTVTVTVASGTTTGTKIYDIQYSATGGDSPLINTTVTLEGVTVVAAGTSGYYIQDAEGAWNGVLVYETTNKPAVGDKINLTAVVAEYNGLTELKTVTGYSVVSSGNPVAIATVTAAVANTEDYEGCIVKVAGAECTAENVSGTWSINDGTGELKVYKTLFDFTAAAVGTTYDVTGVMTWFKTGAIYEILPRTADDVDIVNAIENINNYEFNVYPNPVENILHINNTNNISRIVVSNVLGQSVSSINVENTNIEVSFDGLNKGIYFVSLYCNESILKTVKVTKK
jgi:hypothetical protein